MLIKTLFSFLLHLFSDPFHYLGHVELLISAFKIIHTYLSLFFWSTPTPKLDLVMAPAAVIDG